MLVIGFSAVLQTLGLIVKPFIGLKTHNPVHMNKPQSLPVVNKCVVFYGCYGDERTLYLPYTGSGT